MLPINNSVVREQMRMKNEIPVRNRENELLVRIESYKNSKKLNLENIITDINQKRDLQISKIESKLNIDVDNLEGKIASLNKKTSPKFRFLLMFLFAILGACAMIIIYPNFLSEEKIAISACAGAFFYIMIHFFNSIVVAIVNWSVDAKISSLNQKKDRLNERALSNINGIKQQSLKEINKLQKEVESDICREEKKIQDELSKICVVVDQQTIEEITDYDNEVNAFCSKLLNNPDMISPMVDFIVQIKNNVEQKENYSPLITSDFTFEVSKTQVIFDLGEQNNKKNSAGNRQHDYIYDYINHQNSKQNNIIYYDFCKERFRNLTSNSECEGLAKALVLLTKARMIKISPTIMVKSKHIDSKVTIHFQDINPDYVPAKDF